MKIKSSKEVKTGKSNQAKIIGEVIGIIIGLVFVLYIFPLLPFTTIEYFKWMPIGYWSTIITGILKIFSLAFKNIFFSRIFKICADIVSLYSTYYLIKIFPFDFAMMGYPVINSVFSFALFLASIVIFISIIVQLIKATVTR